MALNDLKKVDLVGGFFIGHIRDEGGPYILFDHIDSRVSFKLQDGPAENGVNGCSEDCLIGVAIQLLVARDPELSDDYNTRAIASLKEAMAHLDNRRQDIERKAKGL